MLRVSIIIPVLNEATGLPRTLRCLSGLEPPAWEVLVVDGGSTDATIAIAEAAGVQVLRSAGGRAVQLNQGAAAATGEIFCFLHGDTLVPDDLIAVVQQTLSDPTIACGGFISLMTGAGVRWGISLHNFLKTYYAPLLFRPHRFLFRGFRLLFGDQVMFCRGSDFWSIGGFDRALPIMEDADLCRRIGHLGRIVQVNRVVQSSDRRVAKWGPLRATAIYLTIGFLWGLGAPAPALKKLYDEIR